MVHIRTDREIDLIAASCQIVADTLEMLSEHVVPGAKITDLDKLAEEFMKNNIRKDENDKKETIKK